MLILACPTGVSGLVVYLCQCTGLSVSPQAFRYLHSFGYLFVVYAQLLSLQFSFSNLKSNTFICIVSVQYFVVICSLLTNKGRHVNVSVYPISTNKRIITVV